MEVSHRSRALVPGLIAFSPEVDPQILRAGDHYLAAQERLLEGSRFATVAEAEAHQRRLKIDDGYATAHSDLAELARLERDQLTTHRQRLMDAMESAHIEGGRRLLHNVPVLRSVLERRRADRLSMQLRNFRNAEIALHHLVGTAGWEPPALTSAQLEKQLQTAAPLALPDLHTSLVDAEAMLEFAHESVLRTRVEQIHNEETQSRRQAADQLVNLQSPVGWFYRSLRGPWTRRRFRKFELLSTDFNLDGPPDAQVSDLLGVLGYPAPFDQREQLTMLGEVERAGREMFEANLESLARAQALLLVATGESTLRGALAQVRQSRRAEIGPQPMPRREILSGHPGLGKRR